MSAVSHPEITSHEAFRALTQEFFNPYPPYVVATSQEDVKLVLSKGCEPEYLLVLDAGGPSGTKSLKSDDIGEFRGRVGIVIYAPSLGVDLSIAATQILELLAIDGTAIGFVPSQQSAQWKQACFDRAKAQKTENEENPEHDGTTLEWSAKDVEGGEWVQWSVVKKAPEWAFC